MNSTPANITDIFLDFHYTYCVDCKREGSSNLYKEDCSHCRVIRSKYFANALSYLKRFDVEAFEGGVRHYKFSSPLDSRIPPTTLDQFYTSTKFCWYNTYVNNGEILQMLVYYSIRLGYYKLSKVKPLILILKKCGAKFGLIPSEYYLYNPDDLQWLFEQGAIIEPHYIPSIFDMNSSFEEIMKLLNFIQTTGKNKDGSKFKFDEWFLGESFQRNLNLNEKKRLLEWCMQIVSTYSVLVFSDSLLWTSFQLHGQDFFKWVLEKKRDTIVQVNGNSVLRSFERVTRLEKSKHITDEHKMSMKTLKQQAIDFFCLVLSEGLIITYPNDNFHDIPMAIVLENTRDADFVIKCISDFRAPVNYNFLEYLLNIKFEERDSNFKCLNARKEIIPILNCVRSQGLDIHNALYQTKGKYRIGLEQELIWNEFLEDPEKSQCEDFYSSVNYNHISKYSNGISKYSGGMGINISNDRVTMPDGDDSSDDGGDFFANDYDDS